MQNKLQLRYIFLSLILLLISTVLFNNITSYRIFAGEETKDEDTKVSYRLCDIVCSYVERLYVYPERIRPKKMLAEALIRLEKVIPELLVDVDENYETIGININDNVVVLDITNINNLRDTSNALKNILVFITKNKRTAKISAEDILYEGLNGLLSPLDPHSVVLPPKEFNEFKIGTSGQFGGLGMVVGIREGMLTVISPIEGTPAHRAGLRPGDQITEIDGESTVNMTLAESVNKLRGKPDTMVSLSVVKYKTAKPMNFTLKRELIKIPTVEDKVVENGIGYIKIRNFQNDTYQSLIEHIDNLKKQTENIKGLIIDLRNNSGGLLDQAVDVTDKFLDSGNIVITVGPGGRNEDIRKAKRSDSDELNFPIVLLIDPSSASGAEIVVGALRENNRGLVIGNRSFGKGSVQQLIDLPDNAALKLTMAKYLTPNSYEVQSKGITPDIMFRPIIISKDEINMFRDISYLREEDLMKDKDKDIVPSGPKVEEPAKTIKYLAKIPEKTEENPEDQELSFIKEDPYKVGDLGEDYLVQFAKRIINYTSQSNREAILKEILPLIEDIERDETEKISNALKKLGIDWSEDKTIEASTSVASLSLKYPEQPSKLDSDSVVNIKAGGKLDITVNVSNKGKATMYRVWGITESGNIYLDNLEFLFGKIRSGETKSYTKIVEIPKIAVDREDELIIKFNELNGYAPNDLKSMIRINSLDTPQFAFSYLISDSGGSGKEGNNDGLIQAGEDIDLVLFIKNIGKGKAEKATISISNVREHEVFVKKGRDVIDELLPDEIKTVELNFKVKKDIGFDKFNMDVLIGESTMGQYILNTLTFSIADNSHLPLISKSSSMLKVLKDRTPVFSGSSMDSDQIALIDRDVVLVSDGSVPGFFWINLPFINKHGWIPANDVEEGVFDDKKVIKERPQLLMRYRPPSIELAMPAMALFTSLEKITLSGIVEDDVGVNHIYIFVNDEKVYFKSSQWDEAKELASKQDLGVDRNGEFIKLEFATEIQLKDGPNAIIIVAQDNENLVTRKSFVITKRLAVARGKKSELVDM